MAISLLSVTLVSMFGAAGLPGAAHAGQFQTASKADQQPAMVQATYAVADLVVPINAPAKGAKTIEETLIKLICHTIDPDSWQESGGEASIQYYPLGMGLVVRQTPDNQKQVADLLATLRRLQDLEVTVEQRLVAVTPEVAEHFMALAHFEEQHPGNPQRSVQAALLDDRVVRSWLEIFQGHKETEIMQAPKITVFNGQACELVVAEEQYFGAVDRGDWAFPILLRAEVGLCSRLLPVIAADRQSVRLHLAMTHTSVASGPVLANGVEIEKLSNRKMPPLRKLKLEKVLVIPDGKTMVCRLGSTCVETPAEFAGSSACRTIGYGIEMREVFLLVTARVIVNEEEERAPDIQALPGK